MKTAVVIPTYWGELNVGEEVIFDHPTPLYTEGTLARLLDNLATFEEMKSIPVYIVGISNKEALNREVQDFLAEYLKPYREKLKIELFSYDYLQKCIYELGERNELSYLFKFKGYSQARNFSLLPVIMNDIDLAIFLDDDEIIEDRDYFKRALEHVNEETKHGKVYGKAGYYITCGSYKVPTDKVPFWRYSGWNKAQYMNDTFEAIIESGERLSVTAIALGGNVVLTKDVMKDICYDVHVHRGEDMDYLFNARIYGYPILFDNQLKITHLPPEHHSIEWKKARADFYRFKYARQKLKSLKHHNDLQQITIDDMMLYPGIFIKDDFETRAKDYMQMLGMHYLSCGEIENYQGAMENMKVIFDETKENIDLVAEYKRQRNDWKTVISILFDKKGEYDV
ncbi:MAG: hypothetical protein KAX49_14355 [Halanaerobiales bacterium]|nr:hypothetical protein [Halanaerobiales bacterium]